VARRCAARLGAPSFSTPPRPRPSARAQLAYFRDQGRFDATYESAMTRLFLHGRTETVRPVSRESCDFGRLMVDAAASPRDKLLALQRAAARHVATTFDAMSGKGIDRHLFALYVVALGTSTDSPFLKDALGVPWKLSTSQQPQQQTTLWDIKDPRHAKRISPGGGFGPVHDDGYGVSYMVSGERELFFHVSSKVHSSHTDSARFVARIFAALDDMREVMSAALALPAAEPAAEPPPPAALASPAGKPALPAQA
jgi:carnitine O-palmitoyltransferase 1